MCRHNLPLLLLVWSFHTERNFSSVCLRKVFTELFDFNTSVTSNRTRLYSSWTGEVGLSEGVDGVVVVAAELVQI